MNKLELLDCTLRDGGYVNDWSFLRESIDETLNRLVESGIDVIECGYFSTKRAYIKDSSYFSSMQAASEVVPDEKKNTRFVVMINFGECDISDIPDSRAVKIDGVRVAFHKRDKEAAILFCEKLILKGFQVYLQPMVALSYTDGEFLALLRRANEISPYAFYIVDSFGAMKSDDLLHLFYLVDYNLADSIRLGFHSHNNLQLSYSHAQMLTNQQTDRTVIIDASVMGMGRGAGNLNTELFADYLNRVRDSHYCIPPLLEIMDHVVAPIYQNKYWGYSLPYYLSATHNCHPNYATFLDDMNTLTFQNINDIFTMMLPEKKVSFDKKYISDLYLNSQEKNNLAPSDNYELRQVIQGKKVLVIAPGHSVADEEKTIDDFIKQNHPVVIAINHLPERISVNFVFVGNIRRWDDLKDRKLPDVILTSNLGQSDVACQKYVVNYSSLLNDQDMVRDNSGLMLLALLIQLKAQKIYLAGMDGYSGETEPNFVRPNLEFHKKPPVMNAMNQGLSIVISRYKKLIPIEFLTLPRYICKNYSEDV